VNKEEDTNTFLSIGKTLAAAGWKIIKYKDHGTGISLTIVPATENGVGNGVENGE